MVRILIKHWSLVVRRHVKKRANLRELDRSFTYVQECRLMRFNALYEYLSQCHFHIASYSTELCVFYILGDFLGKMTLRDGYHKNHASH